MTDSPDAQVDRLLLVHDLGVVAYDTAYDYQREVAKRRIAGEIDQDVLILCEHPPVVTLGRSTKPGHLLATPERLAELGIALRDIERGGDVTIHEPGQLVAYPIIDLKHHRKDLHWYLRQLEAAIIEAVGEFGVAAHRREGLTGVWCGSEHEGWRKLASIGVHARDWVTWHGLALNVTNDLSTFEHVVPCGLGGVEMTSVLREGGQHVSTQRGCGDAGTTLAVGSVGTALSRALARVLSLDLVC
jgi:lipoate-protein ligase B